MKQIIPTYSFVAASKTVTLTDFATVRLDRLLLITNVTRNVIYYNFADAATGATVATNVITLVGASTTGHANTDKLEVIYDTVSGDPDYMTVQPVAGTIASGATDSGNPVKAGGRYNSTPPTLTDGQRGDLQVGPRGALRLELVDGSGVNTAYVLAPADGLASSLFGPLTLGMQHLFNGSTWDRKRGAVAASVLTSAARTTTQTQADQTNYNHRGVVITVDVTTVGTGSITMSLQGKDANGVYYTILAGAAIITVSNNVYFVYPDTPAATNVSAARALPRTYRVVMTANNANSVTYSVATDLVL